MGASAMPAPSLACEHSTAWREPSSLSGIITSVMSSDRPLPPSPLRLAGRWLPALLLVGVGVVTGWLVISGVLALPLAEGILFLLGALAAAAFLAGAVFVRLLWLRAFMIGGLVGSAGSLILVALLVVS